MVKFQNINLKLDNTNILNDICFSLPSRGMYGLFGPSGAGKTSILNLINKTITSYDGTLDASGRVATIFQEPKLYENLSLKDNIYLLKSLYKFNKEDYLYYLKLLKLDKLEKTKVSKLSGGERERVEVLKGILFSADILLSDEPTASLDENNEEIIFNTLKEYSKTKLVIIISHNVSLAKEYVCDYLEIKDGKLTKTLNISDDIKPKEFKIKSNIFKTVHYYLKNSFESNAFVIISSILVFLSVYLFSSLFFFNENKFEYNYMCENDVTLLVLKNDDGYVLESDEEAIFSDYSYYSIATDVNLIPLSIFGSEEVHLNGYVVQNVAIDDSLEDNELNFTKSRYRTLINLRCIDSDSTGFTYLKERYSITVNNIESNESFFQYLVFMNTNTLLKLARYSTEYRYAYLNYSFNASSIDSSLTDNNVILPQTLMDKLGLSIGDEIDIALNNGTFTFVISDVSADTIYFSEDYLYYLFIIIPSGVAIDFTSLTYEDFLSFLSISKDYSYLTILGDELDENVTLVSDTIKDYNSTLVFLIVVLVIFMFVTSMISYKTRKNKILNLYYLNVSTKKITAINILSDLFLLIIGFILTTIIYYYLYKYINIYLQHIVSTNVKVVERYQIKTLFIPIIIFIIYVVCSLLNLIKYHKKDIYNLINA